MRYLLLFTAVLFASPAFAEVKLQDPWSPPSLIGSTTGVAYLTLLSDSHDAVVSASSPVAKVVELHTHEKDGNIVRMRKLETIALPSGHTVTLAPRGLHLMLYGLKRPLIEGQRFPLTLQFTHAKPVTVEAVVSQQKLLDFLR